MNRQFPFWDSCSCGNFDYYLGIVAITVEEMKDSGYPFKSQFSKMDKEINRKGNEGGM